MACIAKLANAIAYDCDSGATGLVSALIINKADITGFTVDTGTMIASAFTLATKAKAYKIDTVKRSLVVSTALKVNDGAPNAQSHTVTGTITQVQEGSARLLEAALSNGSFVVMTKPVAGNPSKVYGLYYGLSATALDTSSHDNGGWISFTLETPENVIGEDSLAMFSADYDALYAAAVG